MFLKKGDTAIVCMEAVQRLEQSKVVGTLSTVLHQKQVQHLADKNLIPEVWRDRFKKFEKKKTTIDDMMPPSDSDEEGGGNLNQRRQISSSDEEI